MWVTGCGWVHVDVGHMHPHVRCDDLLNGDGQALDIYDNAKGSLPEERGGGQVTRGVSFVRLRGADPWCRTERYTCHIRELTCAPSEASRKCGATAQALPLETEWTE